ncbi:four-carbon acid sugar kinase family protein [Herbiconiux moechotypicola]|uniref:3-oxo-tetronate kinase n=1 Tax=Herbiconiux moechotypicola TaxID=637393 RepID=A0ABN3D8M1_9MICO|nr:3-oxo-tetronate kinase [Herbiconiux moechotypicola]MCS5728217.1 four-carbon acid sugar kinase family protein [Herbiconiux moechotypicola]
MIRLAAIADDFTGATDLATSLRERGLRVAVVLGAEAVPSSAEAKGLDAVIVALKSRTAPVAEAVSVSLDSVRALRELEPGQYFVKYCSTFDSTSAGNIGPVLDAVLGELGERRTVVVPAFPDNARTVFQGHLFVGGELLSDSPMRHHPLTPMTESRVSALLTPQTSHPVTEVSVDSVWAGADALRDTLDALPDSYVVVDATTNADLETIQAATTSWRVLSGSAGLAFGMRGDHDPANQRFDAPEGRRLVVCGSASAKTREQIAAALAAGAAGFKLDVQRLLADPGAVVAEVSAWLAGLDPEVVPVVYSVATLDDIRDASHDAAPAVEGVLSRVVVDAVARLGVRRVIVAGGETSGAVTTALGCTRLLIGPQIAPGVCWSLSTTGAASGSPGTPVALALKSGNFGSTDMFSTAWEALS